MRQDRCHLPRGCDVIGRAELFPEAERHDLKEGPFTELPGCSINKEGHGHILPPSGDIVSRCALSDAETLFGRAVDDDADITDKNRNVLGHAERWVPEVPNNVSPVSRREVDKEDNNIDRLPRISTASGS